MSESTGKTWEWYEDVAMLFHQLKSRVKSFIHCFLILQRKSFEERQLWGTSWRLAGATEEAEAHEYHVTSSLGQQFVVCLFFLIHSNHYHKVIFPQFKFCLMIYGLALPVPCSWWTHLEALTWQAIYQRGLNVIFLVFVATIVNVPNVLSSSEILDHHFV